MRASSCEASIAPSTLHDVTAELDYAYLAEFAKVSDGLLTAVGASFTHVGVAEFGLPFMLHVAGRVRGSMKDQLSLAVTLESPGSRYTIRGGGDLSTEGARPYKGDRVGILFAISMPVVLTDPGIYTVRLAVNDTAPRTLRFEAERAQG